MIKMDQAAFVPSFIGGKLEYRYPASKQNFRLQDYQPNAQNQVNYMRDEQNTHELVFSVHHVPSKFVLRGKDCP